MPTSQEAARVARRLVLETGRLGNRVPWKPGALEQGTGFSERGRANVLAVNNFNPQTYIDVSELWLVTMVPFVDFVDATA